MDYKSKAAEALEKRARLVHEMQGVAADKTLTDAQKQERCDRLGADVTALEAEARSYVEQAEREAEVRNFRGTPLGRALGGATEARAQHADGEWLAGEVRTITEGAGLGQALTPGHNDSGVSWFDRLSPKSVLLESGVTVIRTEQSSVPIPRLTGDPATAWVAEGGTIPSADESGDTVTATPRKIAVLTDITNEAIADSDPRILDVHAKAILRSAALRFDLGAYEGSGVAPEIRGLKNVAGIQTLSMGTNGAQFANLDPIADALGMLADANGDADNAVIVMHSKVWRALSKLKEDGTSNKPLLSESAASPGGKIERHLFGAPVFLTTQLSLTDTQGTSNLASSVYVYDPAQIYAVVRQDAKVFLDPYSQSASDKTRVRLTLRGDVVAANPAAVVRVAGVLTA
ncbi:MAG: phage major capsid protein [Actinomycetales bacterium]